MHFKKYVYKKCTRFVSISRPQDRHNEVFEVNISTEIGQTEKKNKSIHILRRQNRGRNALK